MRRIALALLSSLLLTATGCCSCHWGCCDSGYNECGSGCGGGCGLFGGNHCGCGGGCGLFRGQGCGCQQGCCDTGIPMYDGGMPMTYGAQAYGNPTCNCGQGGVPFGQPVPQGAVLNGVPYQGQMVGSGQVIDGTWGANMVSVPQNADPYTLQPIQPQIQGQNLPINPAAGSPRN